MNCSDFLIIYLTFGAPLGVFYFLQNRKKQTGASIWIKTFFTFIFWLPFGFHLLEDRARNNFPFHKKVFTKSDNIETEIFSFQKRLEDILQKSDLKISIFEFREIFERYVGLTLAKTIERAKTIEYKKDFFQIINHKNAEIGGICLTRRHLNRLTFHQIQARRDFFCILGQFFACASDNVKFSEAAVIFFSLLNDSEALSELKTMSFDNLQNALVFPSANGPINFLPDTEIAYSPLTDSNVFYLQPTQTKLSTKN